MCLLPLFLWTNGTLCNHGSSNSVTSIRRLGRMVFSTLRFDWYESLDITRYFYLSWNCGNKFIKSQWWLYQTFTTVGSLALYAISFILSPLFSNAFCELGLRHFSGGVGIVLTAIVAMFALVRKSIPLGWLVWHWLSAVFLVINLFSQTGH